MSTPEPPGGPLRCVFLGYLWKVARALHASPAARLLAVGLEPQRSRSPEARDFCESSGTEAFDARKVRRSGDMARWLREELDLLVVGAFGQILPSSLIEAPRLGTLNVHPSRLPAYRGGWPVEWQILRGERRGGVSLHWMTGEVDAGPLAAQSAIAIGEDDDYETVLDRCHGEAETLMADLLTRPAPNWPRTPQEGGDAPVPARSRADGLVDWAAPTETIRRLVLAEGWRQWVRTEMPSGDLVLERVETAEGRPGAPPGEVLAAGPQPVVATGDGAVRLIAFRSPVELTDGRRLPSTPREEA